MKVVQGGFGKKKETEAEDLPPTIEEVCTACIEASEELLLDEIVIICRSSETGSLVVVANQNLVDQNFMFDAAKAAMFSNILMEE
jgi:hypothetical protein